MNLWGDQNKLDMNLQGYKSAIVVGLVAMIASATFTILYSSIVPTSLATPLGIVIGGVFAYAILNKIKQ
jgi:hypothetical protein